MPNTAAFALLGPPRPPPEPPKTARFLPSFLCFTLDDFYLQNKRLDFFFNSRYKLFL
jgi:hypothetical protein